MRKFLRKFQKSTMRNSVNGHENTAPGGDIWLLGTSISSRLSYDFITLYLVRLIVFNTDTFSCKIWLPLSYHFKTQLNLLGYCVLCESGSLYLIRSMHDQNLLIPHTFYHITTTSRKFLYFMCFFIKTS